MASIITATTTSGLTQSADNSGVLQLASGVGNLVTVPAVTGTAMVSGAMPAFRAHSVTPTSITATVFTIVPINTEDFDTNSSFNPTASGNAYAFQPTVAGYYQLNATIVFGGSITRYILSFYKNGSAYSRPIDVPLASAAASIYTSASDMIYLNGTTDYVQLYGWANGTSLAFNVPATNEWPIFSASLVRTA
jgi:hypothetical protein